MVRNRKAILRGCRTVQVNTKAGEKYAEQKVKEIGAGD
jgi:hypothetical protein